MSTARSAPWGIACAVAAVAVYALSLRNGFVYDDVRVILDRTDIQSLANWREILSSGWRPNSLYRPLTKLSLAVDWAVSGGAPWYFHLVNTLMHAAVTLLVWVFARRWIGVAGATVAALLFAVHPVHVEAVANVVGRAEILATLFALLAAILYRRDGELLDENPSDRRRLLTAGGTLLCTVLGLASKESAFAIPGLLLLVDWCEARRTSRPFEHRLRQHAVVWLGVVILSVEWMLLRGMILGGLAGDDPAPGLYGQGLLGRILVMLPVVLQYVRLLVFPLALSADYSPDFLPAVPSITGPALAGLAVLAVVSWWGWHQRDRAPWYALGLAWIGVSLFIVSNILVPTGILLAERSLYLPSVGIVILAGELVHRHWLIRRNAIIGVLSVVVLLASVRTVARIPVWRSNDDFFPRLVADAPGSFRSLWVAGQLAFVEGNPQRGESLIRQAIQVYPLFANTWQSLAQRLEMQQRWAESAQAFAIAFRLDQARIYDAASAVSNWVRAGMPDSAASMVREASEYAPHDFRLLAARGDLAFFTGRPLEAMTWRRLSALYAGERPFYWYLSGLTSIAADYCPELRRSIRKLEAIDGADRRIPELRDSLEVINSCR